MGDPRRSSDNYYRMWAIDTLRANAQVMRVALGDCDICGPVAYVILSLERPVQGSLGSASWDAFWAQAEDSRTFTRTLRSALAATCPASWTVPLVRLVPDGAISTSGELDPTFRCHSAESARITAANAGSPEFAAVRRIWKEVLQLDTGVAFDDDFFDLGGDSLTAFRAAREFSDLFQTSIPLNLLFTTTVAGSLAEKLRALRQSGQPSD